MAELRVTPAHRADCRFGPGFFRMYLTNGEQRYLQTEKEVSMVGVLIGNENIKVVERDGHCLDGDRLGDANTPDVVDAEYWLNLPQAEAMALVGLESDKDYARVARDIESAVSRRNNRESQTGVHASIVLKKKGRPLIDVLAEEGLLG